MRQTSATDQIGRRYARVRASLNERARRLFVASEAVAHGYGGISVVSRATGVARRTIGVGIAELRQIEAGGTPLWGAQRVRKPGAGRKKTTAKDPTLLSDLQVLVESTTRGDPESPLLWTARSQRNLVAALVKQGHQTSMKMVARLLKEDLGYRLQANRKRLEGAQHPDRNAQFEHLHETMRQQLAAHEPVISVDTKKKELVGLYKNGGRELRAQGDPEDVQVHDFVGEAGKVAPYGVYDLQQNDAWVSVGISHDTAEFAVETVRTWWAEMGAATYPRATSLVIAADGGGSNGYRVRLWKLELQRLVDELGFPVTVCHLPPGTSKWNKIEHRLFSFITQNWRGKPLITHQVIVNLIAATTTKAGLSVRSRLDTRRYAKGRRVSDAQLAAVHLAPHAFHGEWNYTIHPTGTTL
jgi:Rhodopirellula transposase DDE domain